VPASTGRREEIFIEENTIITMRSLSQLSMWNSKISLEFLSYLQKATPEASGMILVQHEFK